MKKQFFLLLSGFLFIMTVLSAPLASAADPGLTVSAQVNNSTKVVTISGIISGGAGQQVSVVVNSPSGGVDYIDQTSSGSEGSYVFHYTLDESVSGTYGVTVGGSGVSSPVTTAFTYTVQATGNGPSAPAPTVPANGPGTNPTKNSPVEDKSKSFVVDTSSLTSSAGPNGNSAIVNVPDGKEEVLLPYNAAELLGSKSLTIQTGKMAVTFQSEVLGDLVKLTGGKDLEKSQISFLFKPTAQEEVNKTLLTGQHGTKMKAAGQAMRFDLSMATKEGRTNRLNTFSKPVEVAFTYDQKADANLLGIYQLNQKTGQWEYIGGKIDGKNRKIVAQLSSFGTCAVMEYEKLFSDVPANYWANSTIKILSAKHIIHGVTDTEFAPTQNVTRAEFAALLVRVLDLKEAKHSQSFKDVSSMDWYAGAVASAYEAGIISGKSAESFAPNANIAREEMAAMLIRALEYVKGKQTTGIKAGYADQDKLSGWAEPYVNRSTEVGLMKGTDHHRFSPKAYTTRAESAQAIYNLFMKLDQI